MKKSDRAAREARLLVQCFDIRSAKREREIFIFEVLTTTGARSSKSFDNDDDNVYSAHIVVYITFMPNKRKCTPPVLYDVINIE